MVNWFKFLSVLLFVSISRDTVRSHAPVAIPGICKSMFENHGYRCEEHTVTTKDGYILSLQRITDGRKAGATKGVRKTPVLLQHGIFADGVVWLLNSPDDSLGYILADSGYDVWIANGRGTLFSRRRTKSSSHEYWDWTWDELVAYDLPVIYQYVYNHSGRQKIHYIGHSLGTLMALASFCQMKLVKMTRSAVLLCPIAYLNGVKSPMARTGADAYFAETCYALGFDEFNPTAQPVHELLKQICKLPGTYCSDLLTSFTVLRKGTIAKFDYNNEDENMKQYGQSCPPSYDISALPAHLPLLLAHGGEDALSDVEDVRRLLAKLRLRKRDKLEVLYRPEYAHADFIIGTNARKLVYNPILRFLKSH